MKETRAWFRSRIAGRSGETPNNPRVIVAASAVLVVLVATVLCWLGWRLLSQEETLARQQTRNRLEQAADTLLAGVNRRMTETEAALSQMGAATFAATGDPLAPQPQGAVLVALSQTRAEARPAGAVLYYPILSPVPALDEEVFAEANKAEFQTNNLNAAVELLRTLTAAKDPLIRTEALLRLGRVQSKSGRAREALAAYEVLAGEERISPLVEAPYGLLARIERCQLLARSGHEADARRESEALAAGLESGRWPLSKEAYDYYSKVARDLAGADFRSSPELALRLAISEQVERLWKEWQFVRQSGSGSMTRRLHGSDPVPVITVLNANPERLVAMIYPGGSLRLLGLDAAGSVEGEDLRSSLVDEHGRLVFGATPDTTQLQATRTLSLEIPWRFSVALAGAGAANGFLPNRRVFYLMVLAGIVLLVALACYAMTRGVLREAAAGRLQSDFVSAVSHEFRSPLTTLRQLTELLAEGRIHDESRRRLYFEVLQQETSRLQQLVEDLLDFGRIDAGRRQYELEPLDLSELVKDGIHEYQRQANGTGHRIELTCRGDGLVVKADREALRRVVRNLLENAVKYSPNAQTVWVETGSEGNAAVLRIRDEGIGIPPEEQSRIFEKFVRGESAKQACIPGTGVGLAMVKEIVRVHQGEVGLDSEAGRGSTFMVRLPLSAAGAAAPGGAQ